MQILTGWFGRAISFALFHSPAFVRRAIANILAFLWFDLLRIRRQVVLDNIAIAFPELTHAQAVRMGRKSLQNLGLNLVEYSFLPWLTRDNYQKYFRFENQEIFDQLIARGKGVLLMTLHLGHGDLGCAAMSLHGWKMVMVSKFFKLKWLNDLWFGMRERLGTRFIPPRDSSYSLLKALRGGASVAIPLDQFTGPPIGVPTQFFGKTTGTAAGLAVMAERSGAAILSVYTYRDVNGGHVIHFEREMSGAKTRATEDTIAATQSFTDELEKFVRRHPEQWMWIHRRWKTYEVT